MPESSPKVEFIQNLQYVLSVQVSHVKALNKTDITGEKIRSMMSVTVYFG